MFAVIIFSAALFFVGQSVLEHTSETAIYEMKKQANDILDILDSKDYLEEFDNEKITNTIDGLLMPGIDWKMRIESYTYSGGTFILQSTINIGNHSIELEGKKFVKSRRLFITFSGSKIDKYNSAELWLWKK